MNERTDFESYADIAEKEAWERLTAFTKTYVEPWVTSDIPPVTDRKKAFKALKKALANLSHGAYSVPASKEMLLGINAFGLFKQADQASEIVTLAHAMLHPGSLATLGREFYDKVYDAAKQALTVFPGKVNVEVMLAKLPHFPATQKSRSNGEEPYDELVDHDCEKVKDLSHSLPKNAAPFYLTREQIRSAHPMNDDSGPAAWPAHNAAMVMVSERYLKADLVHLVAAALQFQTQGIIVPAELEQERNEFEAMMRNELGVPLQRMLGGWYAEKSHDFAWISWCRARGIPLENLHKRPTWENSEEPHRGVADVQIIQSLTALDDSTVSGTFKYATWFVHHLKYKSTDSTGYWWIQTFVSFVDPSLPVFQRVKVRDGTVHHRTCDNSNRTSEPGNWSAWSAEPCKALEDFAGK